jgi:hypothetical protein
MPAIAPIEDLRAAQKELCSMFLAFSPCNLRLTTYDKKGLDKISGRENK